MSCLSLNSALCYDSLAVITDDITRITLRLTSSGYLTLSMCLGMLALGFKRRYNLAILKSYAASITDKIACVTRLVPRSINLASEMRSTVVSTLINNNC